MRKRIRTVGPIVAIIVAICVGAVIALRGQPDVVPLTGLSAPRWLERIYGLQKSRKTSSNGTLRTDIQVSGQAPQMDDTDKLAASMYGKDSVAGDTPVSLTSDGELSAHLAGGTGAMADGDADVVYLSTIAAGNRYYMIVRNQVFNGATWDRPRNNVEVTALASVARITTTASSSLTNYNHSGMVLFLDVTGRSGTTSLTPNIQIQDPVGNEWLTIWTAAAVISSSNTSLVYSFSPYSANTDTASLYTEEVELVLPRTWRVAVTHSDSVTVTYSIAASMIP